MWKPVIDRQMERKWMYLQVLQLIQQYGAISRVEIANKLHMTRASVTLLIHEMIGCAAVGRCLAVVCQFGDMLPHLACGIVLKHHLSDRVGDGSAMAGCCGTTLFLSAIDFVELWEENVLLLSEVTVEFLKRSGYSISHV